MKLLYFHAAFILSFSGLKLCFSELAVAECDAGMNQTLFLSALLSHYWCFFPS